ncbi:MAG: single-stranded DNA-binding protein [Chloroflexi bacterium]|nr:single-stranded DNA-binding protein [Chloroflexota bacterium]MCH9038493.1 single-stranded DNA-binding protein [Chloroflexota bacterium]MCI0770530.1 single-stranded DNA-binding protein [Chloroflexota bacterium]MCI0795965.1 single-stranded DNA-binding protein [Chloroflexota bacterium]MCI0868194.1 single-stranded DNA-binding protein [Chloroflexota bacterium]
MVGLNKMMAIGNVGTDPEMRYTPNGNPVTSFRLATGRSYTASDGERKQETEWFTVVAWNQLAEQVNQYLVKGRRVYVEGRLKSNTWTSQDGQSRFRNEIIASRVLFLDRMPAGGPNDESGPPTMEGQEDPAMAVGDAEDLPW